MFAGAKGGEGHGYVQGRGRADHDRVNFGREGSVEVGECFDAVSLSDGGSQLITGITAGNHGPTSLLETTEVSFADTATAYYENGVH